MRTFVLLLAILACSGCTHQQLSRSMVQQASTIMNIEYQMVVDNLAMLTYNPAVLPWAIRINDGTVQVNDEAACPSWACSGAPRPALRAPFAPCAA